MTATHPLALPLINIYAKGGYTVKLHIGSQQTEVNLIVDSGSSTLVVGQVAYHPEDDTDLTATSFAQEVTYGIGGWDGPVINTNVTIGNDTFSFTLNPCPVAVVSSLAQRKTFGEANGILGLAYYQLNSSYDLHDYLVERNVSPPVTYPWPFSEEDSVCPNDTHHHTDEHQHFSSNDLTRFKAFLKTQPEQDILPYFTQLETQGLCANKFAFYSQRSSVHVASATPSKASLAADPLNQGWLILGGGKEQTHLYQGQFKHIKVEHNVHYNVTLVGIKVGDFAQINAADLKPEFAYYLTNAIIDTGTSGIMLTDVLFEGLKQNLHTLTQTVAASKPNKHTGIPQDFLSLIAPFTDLAAQEVGIDAELLDLTQWPDIEFIFAGHSECDGHGGAPASHTHSQTQTQTQTHTQTNSHQPEPITLTCKPHDYWQLNSPLQGKACFKIIGKLPQWGNQSLIGLPLLNNYYVIFDREEHKTGVIRFAEQVPFESKLVQGAAKHQLSVSTGAVK
ncbi:pepsin-like aspartic protease [Shewanella sp. 3_MG-2023]|uniref:pepsin-like aspartic protease n=1 Tax=Shewanella sp. 3_MG-2023 TaxID=3062635 RepID=UPI0026E367FD|nr:pepsin-like aspartic protease [Shewanella sp. 3_MG-2023]MDO6777158.1 pepsin-like aspartic protease [Shewanella sp. 3_MG-2023]